MSSHRLTFLEEQAHEETVSGPARVAPTQRRPNDRVRVPPVPPSSLLSVWNTRSRRATRWLIAPQGLRQVLDYEGIDMASCQVTIDMVEGDIALRHAAYVSRYPFRFWRYRVKCARCKKLHLGPFFSYEYADVLAYGEAHRKAHSCRRREKDRP